MRVMLVFSTTVIKRPANIGYGYGHCLSTLVCSSHHLKNWSSSKMCLHQQHRFCSQVWSAGSKILSAIRVLYGARWLKWKCVSRKIIIIYNHQKLTDHLYLEQKIRTLKSRPLIHSQITRVVNPDQYGPLLPVEGKTCKSTIQHNIRKMYNSSVLIWFCELVCLTVAAVESLVHSPKLTAYLIS